MESTFSEIDFTRNNLQMIGSVIFHLLETRSKVFLGSLDDYLNSISWVRAEDEGEIPYFFMGRTFDLKDLFLFKENAVGVETVD